MESEQLSNPDLFLDVPFSKRWDCHQSTILRLYIDEDRPVKDVADIMKRIYLFDADVRSYKYHLKKWNVFKSISSTVKDKAIRTLGKRRRNDKTVGGIRYRGAEINKQKLRRYMKENSQQKAGFILTSIIFTPWNLPYRALKATPDHPTPGASDSSTPSDFSVFTPPAIRDRPTPGANAASPADAPTPTVQAIQRKTHFDRSRSFLQGDFKGFLKGMSSSDRVVAITWLHQFWIFAFTTLKHWGVGPQKWTADRLRMSEFSERYSLPGTPCAWGVAGDARSPYNGGGNQPGVRHADHQQYRIPQPSSLCRWCIHVRPYYYDRVSSPPPEEDADFDVEDSSSWPRWIKEPCTVMERLHDALKDNSFSNIDAQDLPLSTSAIVEAVAASPDAISVEVMSFAIMARNIDLVYKMVIAANEEDLDISSIYPYHLAAGYLDGSGACCSIMFELLGLVRQNVIKRLYVNDIGHTVLDSLMLTVLKAHTSCTPNMADERLKTTTRFAGEDLDICGRWDADSPCLRALKAHGQPKIPFQWKHMFCHTSVQAVCHSIDQLFSAFHSPDINTPSGLFVKSCFTCGERLMPGPLHTLVLTAFNLAQHRCEGENLFGMVACLVCLLVNGADPLEKANLSVNLLLQIDDQQECTHARLDPLELGAKVPLAAWNSWSEETKLGWDCFMAVLGFAQRRKTGVNSRSAGRKHGPDDYYFDYSEFLPFTDDQALSDDGDDSSSDESYDFDDDNNSIATTDEACSFYFSNMEVWHRSTYRLLHFSDE
ncbi:hypothetical protein RRF57_011394 [Xylaria bambusicola]|uniref:Clr5 domain-containing protein n=1 Tax=Xylaria bambusicola TaxID=326684 RepID=A0AAN7UTQ3_9PEZI